MPYDHGTEVAETGLLLPDVLWDEEKSLRPANKARNGAPPSVIQRGGKLQGL